MLEQPKSMSQLFKLFLNLDDLENITQYPGYAGYPWYQLLLNLSLELDHTHWKMEGKKVVAEYDCIGIDKLAVFLYAKLSSSWV